MKPCWSRVEIFLVGERMTESEKLVGGYMALQYLQGGFLSDLSFCPCHAALQIAEIVSALR